MQLLLGIFGMSQENLWIASIDILKAYDDI